MASKSLAHGMGSFFKECEHPTSRWSKCPHEYKIRYRSAAGKQTEESGFATQDSAIARLTEVYAAKKATPRNKSKAERIEKYGAMRFEEYTAEWKSGQRHLAPASPRVASLPVRWRPELDALRGRLHQPPTCRPSRQRLLPR